MRAGREFTCECGSRYRKLDVAYRDLPFTEMAAFRDALQLKYNAAQRLFNGGDE